MTLSMAPSPADTGRCLLDGGDGKAGSLTASETRSQWVEEAPFDPHAAFDAGCRLKAKRQWAEALTLFCAILDRKPNEPEVLREAAGCLLELRHLEDALRLARRAAAYEPWDAPGRIFLGHLLGELGRHAEAHAEYREAVRLTPDAPYARWNLALFDLASGDWESGWRQYEWGKTARRRPIRHLKREWSGGPAGTLYVWAEQGLGDTLMALRFLDWLREQFRIGRLVVEVQESLVDLVADLPAVDAVYAMRPDGAFGCPFDAHVSLMSLPTVFSLLPEDLTRRWQPYLSPLVGGEAPEKQERPRVGFCWRGSPSHQNDRHRSLTEAQAAEFLAMAPEVEWVDLCPHAPSLPGLAKRCLPSWRDTAELVAGLEAVVTVDTAVAHLAGGMGKPVGLLLAQVGDFRWGWYGETTPWYPSAWLFRQPVVGEWELPLRIAAGWAATRAWEDGHALS